MVLLVVVMSFGETIEYDNLARLIDALGEDLPSIRKEVIATLRAAEGTKISRYGQPPRKASDRSGEKTLVDHIYDFYERRGVHFKNGEEFKKTLQTPSKHSLLVVYNGMRAAPEIPEEVFYLLPDWGKVYFMAGIEGVRARADEGGYGFSRKTVWDTIKDDLPTMGLGEIVSTYVAHGIQAMKDAHFRQYNRNKGGIKNLKPVLPYAEQILSDLND